MAKATFIRSPWLTERPDRYGTIVPLGEIASRRFELPEPGRIVWVADDEDDLAAAVAQLGYDVRRGAVRTGARTHSWRPSPLVALLAAKLEPRTVVDYGCGGARDAVFLALRGWTVHAIDNLPEAIQRGRQLAESYGVSDRVRFELRDLKANPDPSPAELHLMIRYFNPDLFRRLNDCNIGVQTYSEAHRAKTGHPRSSSLILPAEFKASARYWREKGEFTFAIF